MKTKSNEKPDMIQEILLELSFPLIHFIYAFLYFLLNKHRYSCCLILKLSTAQINNLSQKNITTVCIVRCLFCIVFYRHIYLYLERWVIEKKHLLNCMLVKLLLRWKLQKLCMMSFVGNLNSFLLQKSFLKFSYELERKWYSQN